MSEGQTVQLTADARISDCAAIPLGSVGYIDQITTTKPRSAPREEQDIFPSTMPVSPTEVIAQVHFTDHGLRVWVPAVILAPCDGS